MYKKLYLTQTDGTVILSNSVERISDKAQIPFDEANTDYQEYLKWVAEGNVAEEVE